MSPSAKLLSLSGFPIEQQLEQLHTNKKEQVPSPDSAICCKHLNITRAPNENPIRVTGLENFITAKIYSVRPSG